MNIQRCIRLVDEDLVTLLCMGETGLELKIMDKKVGVEWTLNLALETAYELADLISEFDDRKEGEGVSP